MKMEILPIEWLHARKSHADKSVALISCLIVLVFSTVESTQTQMLGQLLPLSFLFLIAQYLAIL